jgi:hypothetical protein
VCRYANGTVLEVASDEKYPEGVRFIGDGGEVFVSRADLKTEHLDWIGSIMIDRSVSALSDPTLLMRAKPAT